MIYLLFTSVFLIYAIYMLVNIMAAFFYQPPSAKPGQESHKMVVFYPCYRPNEQVIKNLKKQKEELNPQFQKLFVLAQEADPIIEKQLEEVADCFVAKKFSHLTGNSYHHALEFAVNYLAELDQAFESVLLLDPDNFIDQESISHLVSGRLSKAHVALSRRKSYAKSSSISLFDGLSERLNDYMLRRSKMVLNLIPELSGSGMLMEFELFKKAVLKLDKKSPGMDKQLLINMMFSEPELTIVYNENAMVLDEKTEDEDAFTRQRLRWFGNQYYNAFHFGAALVSSGRLSFIDYAISLFRPPRSFQLVFTTAAIPFELMAVYLGLVSFPVISVSALLANISIFLFLYKEGVLEQVIRQLIPVSATAVRNGFTALKSTIKNNSKFIHTRSQK